ncbi:hypothetical protein M413DRAFT_20101 [Hebeloma cylindrosporum]|uniref:Uncharacterized protein n=1 Tax=Hebeloma cylindrosporum TaxID=76867 RepID=A0A0C3BNN1_HEBCY|nr:hypothetical protein M413DRAFT_20101 [Hebeloma cylindrosporum h7]
MEHKRKRSLQDSTVNLSKMRMALNCFESLKEELNGIESTKEEWQTITDHVLALENILKGTKKPRVTSSTLTLEDLKEAGITRKCLVFVPTKVNELTNGLTSEATVDITDLQSRIKKIYERVNMDYEPGSRMILDAVLLALAEISSTQQKQVAILPEMRIGPGDGIHISHPVSGYELQLGGNVDYAVIEYEDVLDNKARLFAPGGSRDDAFEIAKGRLLLVVEAKRQGPERPLVSYIPTAVGQAIALMKSANLPAIRFCLSDGERWIFFLLKSENGTLTYYESAIRSLGKNALEGSGLPLREIIQILCEWLNPTMTDLFVLMS